jgi:hypothetical protein
MHVSPQLQIELTATSEGLTAMSRSHLTWPGWRIYPFCNTRIEWIRQVFDWTTISKLSQRHIKAGASHTSTHLVKPECISVTAMTTTIVSDIKTSGQARLHIGDHNEHHDHRYYGDESQLSPAERQRAREDAIFSSLYFTDMSARERAIDSPYDDTFSWIFDEKVTERERWDKRDICNLMSRWLEYEDGMFFIVGKAGSGK